MEILVTDLSLLRAMEKEDLLEIHPHTGKQVTWNGVKLKAYYLQECLPEFNYKGRKFKSKYISGSFYPYLFEIIN